jgi:cellulose synthase/poly-beta-1,6-N-acetylglucosamine synthase-like glycosyltransferase
MMYFFISLLFMTILYAGFITWCLAGWKKLNTFHSNGNDFKTAVTIIVPVRNEEKNISNCLHDILSQDYPAHLTEIIVADDHSTDNTAAIVNRMMIDSPDHKIIFMNKDEKSNSTLFKKQAIADAVRKSSGELIVTTDGDCRMSSGWLRAIVSYYERERPVMIAGPVCFSGAKNGFEKLQALEFMGLIGIGAGGISNRQPMMCNGANLAYSKKIFNDLDGFSGRAESVSGDDTQLLMKIAKQSLSGIHFLKCPEAIVYTQAMTSVNQLFQQRKRWASKIPLKMGRFTKVIAAVAYYVHAGLLAGLIFTLFRYSMIPVFLFALLIKIIPEFLLLSSMQSFFGRKNLMRLFLPAQIIYMVYITVMGAVSLAGSYQWKGREIKTPRIKLPVKVG